MGNIASVRRTTRRTGSRRRARPRPGPCWERPGRGKTQQWQARPGPYRERLAAHPRHRNGKPVAVLGRIEPARACRTDVAAGCVIDDVGWPPIDLGGKAIQGDGQAAPQGLDPCFLQRPYLGEALRPPHADACVQQRPLALGKVRIRQRQRIDAGIDSLNVYADLCIEANGQDSHAAGMTQIEVDREAVLRTGA